MSAAKSSSRIAERRAGSRPAREAEKDVDDAEQRPVRVGQPPHQPAGFVGHVEVGPHLEAVQRLEHQSETRRRRATTTSRAEMTLGVVGGRRLFSIEHAAVDSAGSSVDRCDRR